jgi:pimeloyl-ACP methyl ester carboxylesterase
VQHGFAAVGDGSGAVRLKCRPEHEAALYVHGGDHGAFERLGEVSCPVTVGTGEPTEGRPSSYAERVVARLPRGRLQRFDGLGHFGPCEAPARMASSIVAAFGEGAP